MKHWDPAVLPQVMAFFNQHIPFNRHIGLELQEVREGFARVHIPFREELIGDPFRPALHGGVISTLIDTAGGAAAFTQVPPGGKVSTIDLRVDYLRPGEKKLLVAEASVTRMGNRVASVDVRVFHEGEEDRLIATGKAVYHVLHERR